MTGHAMRSIPATGPQPQLPDANYGSAPAANYGSTPAANYGSTPAASYVFNPLLQAMPQPLLQTTPQRPSTPAAALSRKLRLDPGLDPLFNLHLLRCSLPHRRLRFWRAVPLCLDELCTRTSIPKYHYIFH